MIQNQWASSTTIIWRIIAISIYNVTCNATTSSWGKTKWRVKGIKVTPTDFIFLFMIPVDPSPVLFYIYFFIWSEFVRVDPTRTDGPSSSSPTFVPASNQINKTGLNNRRILIAAVQNVFLLFYCAYMYLAFSSIWLLGVVVHLMFVNTLNCL